MDAASEVPKENLPQLEAPKNKLMGILSYLGVFVFVPYFVAKDDPFVKFHIKQGLVLLVIEVGVWMSRMILWPLSGLLNIVNFIAIILAIIGIIHVAKGEEKELPLVGSYGQHFKI